MFRPSASSCPLCHSVQAHSERPPRPAPQGANRPSQARCRWRKRSRAGPSPFSTPTPHCGTPRLWAFISPKPQMDILKGLTTTLVEDLQAPVPAGRVRGPGLAAAAAEGHQRPDEEGGRETLHGEGLRATHSERRARDGGPPGGASSPLMRWVTCSVSVLYSQLWGTAARSRGQFPGAFWGLCPQGSVRASRAQLLGAEAGSDAHLLLSQGQTSKGCMTGCLRCPKRPPKSLPGGAVNSGEEAQATAGSLQPQVSAGPVWAEHPALAGAGRQLGSWDRKEALETQWHFSPLWFRRHSLGEGVRSALRRGEHRLSF